MKIEMPYYRERITIDVPDSRVKAVLTPQQPSSSASTEQDIVLGSLSNPIQSPPLSVLAAGKSNVLIITSDHTRPVPSRITLPILLSETRKLSPDVNIKILIATGFHRATTEEELVDKFGPDICASEQIVVHDAFDPAQMVFKGVLPSGGELWVNRLVDWADLIVSEGFIEPHLFAGFSGGRKSVLPGICSKDTIMYNHNAQFIAAPQSRTGILDANPLHEDMLFASQAAGLSFILNVALDENKKIIAAFSGDPEAAHLTGCGFVSGLARVKGVSADLVVTSNGGYPLDQNVYQTVKSMTAAESCINPGGVMIVISSCSDGHGGEGFYNWFADVNSPEQVTERILAIPRAKTTPDQWEAQILARILTKCRKAILVSRHADPDMIRSMHMLHASSFEEALEMADDMLGGTPKMVIIPDGIGVIIEEQ